MYHEKAKINQNVPHTNRELIRLFLQVLALYLQSGSRITRQQPLAHWWEACPVGHDYLPSLLCWGCQLRKLTQNGIQWAVLGLNPCPPKKNHSERMFTRQCLQHTPNYNEE